MKTWLICCATLIAGWYVGRRYAKRLKILNQRLLYQWRNGDLSCDEFHANRKAIALREGTVTLVWVVVIALYAYLASTVGEAP